MTEFSQTYWNELIEKFRDGSISEKERYLLEKQALDDPFLFDALEGFSLYQESEKKESSNKIFTLPRLAIAASLFIMVAVMFNLKSILNNQSQEDQSVAMVLEKDNMEPPRMVEEEAEVITKSDQASNISKNEQLNNNSIKSSQPVESVLGNRINKKTESMTETIETINEIAPRQKSDTKEIVVADSDMEDKPIAQKDDAPIVLESEEHEATVAVVQNAKGGNESPNANKFEGSPQKTEAVLFDSNLIKKKKTNASSFYEAVPVIGKKIFDDYAKQRIDERGLRQEKPQKVTIEFNIDKNGNLTDFHHIFTGCSECGPFAISLLQTSGEWKTVPPGFAGKARYTFTF